MIRKLLLAILVAAILAALWWKYGAPSRAIPQIDLVALQARLERAHEASDRDVEAYQPLSKTGIDTMDAGTAAPILRAFRGVANVDIHPTKGPASNTIIHLRDWHFVHRADFIIDMRNEYGRDLSLAEFDSLYAEHLARP